ncbi:MAG TPA: hypothetical protein VGH19_16090 [Verrucomicrobiae bacterium]
MEANDFFGKLFEKGLGVGEMMLERELFGEPANEREMLEERERWNRINGSGSVNYEASRNAPAGWFETWFGISNDGRNAASVANPNRGMFMLVGVILFVVLLFVFFRKRA